MGVGDELFGLFKQIHPEDRTRGEGANRGAVLDGPEAQQMFEDPLRFVDGGFVGVFSRKAMKSGHCLGSVAAKGEWTDQAAAKSIGGSIEVVRASERCCDSLTILRLLAKGTGFEERCDQLDMFTCVCLREFPTNP